MEKYITIKQSEFEAILGYLDTIMDLVYPEGENIAKVNDGYETFVKPFRETDKLQTPEAFVKNQEFETFCENLQDGYGVDISAADKKVLWNLFDKFHEEFTDETSGIECNIVTDLVNATPLPALYEDEKDESEAQLELLDGESVRYIEQLLGYSTKKVDIDWYKVHNTSPVVLDFATQTIEKVIARTDGLKPVSFGIEHKGYKLPEKVVLQEPDFPTTKKGNMAYWDEIEGRAEALARNLLSCLGKVEAENASFDEDDIEDAVSDAFVDVGAEITEFAVDLLIKEFNAVYPCVDENY